MLRSLSACLLAVAVPALAGCQRGSHRPPCPAGKVCLEVGRNTEALTLDPQKSSLVDEFTIISELIVGLTTDGPDGRPVPAMATSWETSPDGLAWTFHLRDAKWSDGTPVTADDFVYAYRRLLSPQTGSINAYLAYILKNGRAVNDGTARPEALGASAPDAHTLKLTLEHPAPYLLELTKHVSFFPLPRHVVERYGDGWVQPGHHVANGPFKLVSWRLGDHIEVVKNPEYFDAADVCPDRINFYPTPDAIGAERRVASGELDINTNFQSNRIGHLREAMPGVARAHVSLATSYVGFNTHDKGPLQDIRVRRALSQAIDRDFITSKLLRAGQQPAYSFVPPGTANYVAGPRLRWAAMPLAARQASAKTLLAQAGYGPGHPLKITIKSSNATDTLLLMEAIQADWRAIGVDVGLSQNEYAVAVAAYRNRDFQVGGMQWYADFNDPITFLG
ncbi:MAG: Peptide transporter substrate-binding protein, partial [Caulobacteraceae bacterium]|nr:Peptide transporter substrate-binding protein [Caulobacteraceae bacterium]